MVNFTIVKNENPVFWISYFHYRVGEGRVGFNPWLQNQDSPCHATWQKNFFFSANLIHSFHRSEIWTYCVWVLCSNSHRDVSRLCPYLEPRVFPRLTQLVGRVKFLVVVGLRFPCWLWEGTCSQLLEASCVPYHMPLPSSKLAMGTLMKNPCNTSHLSTFGL